MRSILAIILLVICLGLTSPGYAAPAGVSLANEFIRLRVNPGPQEAGRFAIDTTGGDPSRSADDNQVLIYGSREPWTSYTTVLVDGKPFVFGGATERRAGKSAPVGAVTQAPQVAGDTIVCVSRFGEVEIKQDLGFVRSPTTRVKDTARIAYQITNRGNAAHKVGLRLVLDTMLGTNDGAPLRTGERAIDHATRLSGAELPDFWQAFDSLSQPAVIAQGTLRAPGLTPPNRLEMVDWGTLADAPWDFPFPAGADFTRQGEAEQDTAVALYWEPATLAPGETRTYATLYGVGGVTLSPAQLSLGLTAPAEVDYQYDHPPTLNIVAYIENSGGFESRNTVCTLELGKAFKLSQGEAKVTLGLLKPKETRQLTWKIAPTGEADGAQEIAVAVTSENLEANRVAREILVNSPPQIVIALNAPDRLSITPDNQLTPNPFELSAKITNRGGQPAKNLAATLTLPDGLKLEQEAQATKITERLEPGKNLTLTWPVRALGLPSGKLAYSLLATAAGAKGAKATGGVLVPELTPELRVYPAEQVVPLTTDGSSTLLPIAVKLAPARNFFSSRLSLNYDPAILEPLYVSRGEAFVEGGRLLSPWSAGKIVDGTILQMGGERKDATLLNSPETALFTVVFMVKAAGECKITLTDSLLLTGPEQVQQHRLINGHIIVKKMEEKP
jgi:hypothetical protein